MSLVAHLMKSRDCGYEKAVSIAKAIDRKRADEAQKKKMRLERAQFTLGFDGMAVEEPADRQVVTDPTVNF